MAKVYKGVFTNSQVDYTDNTGNEQDIFVTIRQKTPYNFAFTFVTVGPNLEYTFTFDELPDDTTALAIGYSNDNGATWTSQTGSFVSPRTLTLAPADWIFQFVVQRTSGNEIIYSEDEIIDLDLAEQPVLCRVVDTDEDKFTPIRSRNYEVKVHTSDEVDIMNFTDGGDNEYSAFISQGTEDNIIFSGWLSISDLRQQFQPHPNILILTITDGLGFLKDIPISDIDGVNFGNENKIIDYIAGCLVKTGLQLGIVCEMNILESTAPLSIFGHFYNFCYLDALTFESEIGEFEDCFTVLEKILGEDCELSQQKNEWFIKRIDEFDTQNNKQVRFAYDGTVDQEYPSTTYPKNIGADNSKYSLAFMNDDAEMSAIRPYKFVKHIFNYRSPQEIPCNSDFSRGDVINESDPLEITYEIECWTLKEGVPTSPGTVDGTTATIHRIFNADGYEDERYIVLTPRTTFESSSINDPTYIESQPIPIEEKDKFTVSIDFRLDQDIATGGNGNARLFRCILHGDDGSYWILGEATTGDGIPVWYDTANWTTNTAKGDTSVDFDEDDTEWRSISWSAPPAPVTGKLYLWINQFNQLNSADDDREVWYSNLSFTYRPFINGSYTSYTGQYHKSEQEGDYKGSREEEVYISDAPKKLFKGCLLKEDSGEFVKTEGFFNYAVFPSGPPSDDYIHPFGQIQNQSVWNQFNRVFMAFEGTIDGLDTEKIDSLDRTDIPDLMHTFYLKDSHEATNNKQFKLLHYEQDYDLCELDLFLIEVFDTTINKVYTGHEFKYIKDDR